MTIGKRLRAERIARGMTLAWVAERAGVSRPHLSNIERGKCSGIAGPGFLIVQAVAQVIGLSVGELKPIRKPCLGPFVVQRRVK